MSLDLITAELQAISRAATRDFRQLFQEIVDPYITARIEESFAGRQSPDGTPWAAGKKGVPSLVKTGAMKASLVDMADGAVHDITSDHIERGTNIPYSPFQQSGIPKGGRKRKSKFGPPKPGSAAARRLARTQTVRARRRRKRKPGQPMRLPARPFIGFTETDADNIAEMTAEFVAARLEARA